jgi:hypothetical protein
MFHDIAAYQGASASQARLAVHCIKKAVSVQFKIQWINLSNNLTPFHPNADLIRNMNKTERITNLHESYLSNRTGYAYALLRL